MENFKAITPENIFLNGNEFIFLRSPSVNMNSQCGHDFFDPMLLITPEPSTDIKLLSSHESTTVEEVVSFENET